MNNQTLAGVLRSRVTRILSELVPSPNKVLLAVSGGSDSLGMMHLVADVAESLELNVAVAFVDHGLREGVDNELAIVRAQAESREIDVHHAEVPRRDIPSDSHRGSVQAWAREKRYKLLKEIAHGLSISYIATGHTRDDQAETVLLRIIRGTGLDGLAGIPNSRALDRDTTVIRPLLELTRAEIRTYLKERNLSWCDDPSNADNRYQRVRVRHEILPVMDSMHSGVADRIAALASEVGAVSEYLETDLQNSEKLFCNLNLASGIKVDYHTLSLLPRGIWSRIIRIALRRVRGDLQCIERNHIDPIEGLIAAKKSTDELPLPGNVFACLDRGSLLVFPGVLPAKSGRAEKLIPRGPHLWHARSNELETSIELRTTDEALVADLRLRARRPGDRAWNSKNKFKEVLIETRVPRPYRDFVPVLADRDQIIACPLWTDSRHARLSVEWTIDPSAPFWDVAPGKQCR